MKFYYINKPIKKFYDMRRALVIYDYKGTVCILHLMFFWG